MVWSPISNKTALLGLFFFITGFLASQENNPNFLRATYSDSALITADQKGRIHLWDIKDLIPLKVLEVTEGRPIFLEANSLGDSWVLQDNKNHVFWGTRDQEGWSIRSFENHKSPLLAAAFSDSGLWLYSSLGITQVGSSWETLRVPAGWAPTICASWVESIDGALSLDLQGQVYITQNTSPPALWFSLPGRPLSASIYQEKLFVITQAWVLLEVDLVARKVLRRWQLSANFQVLPPLQDGPLFAQGNQLFRIDQGGDLVQALNILDIIIDPTMGFLQPESMARVLDQGQIFGKWDDMLMRIAGGLYHLTPDSKRIVPIGQAPSLPDNWSLWSLDQQRLAYNRGEIHSLFGPNRFNFGQAATAIIYAAAGEGRILTLDPSGKGKLWNTDGQIIDDFELEGDSSALHLGETWLRGGSNGLFSWSKPGFTQERSLSLGEDEITALTLYPEGRLAAVGNIRGEISIVDLVLGVEYQRKRIHRSAVVHLSFSPDGSWLASASELGDIAINQTISGGAMAGLFPQEDGLVSLLWTDDGHLLSLGPSKAQWWDWSLERTVYQRSLSEGRYLGAIRTPEAIFLYTGELWEKYSSRFPAPLLETGKF
jgi:WD40 repeat protein